MSAPTRVEWKGIEVAGRMQDAAADGLKGWADMLRGASQDVVPVLSGALRDTAVASVDPDALEAAVSYDGPYAQKQHEEMDYHHDNGQAKFLEEPLYRTAREGMQILQEAMVEVTGGNR